MSRVDEDPPTAFSVAVQARDLLLPIVRRHGHLMDGEEDASLRLLVLDRPPWSFRHWTPFNALGREEALSPG